VGSLLDTLGVANSQVNSMATESAIYSFGQQKLMETGIKSIN